LITRHYTTASHFDNCRTASGYHFNNNIIDHPGEWFTVIGRFNNVWAKDLDQVKQELMPMTWRNIRSTMGGSGENPNLVYQEYDITSGGGDPTKALTDINDQIDQYSGFKKLVNFFGLEQGCGRLHVQKTGQVFNYHIDTLDLLFPEADPDRLIRFTVMLEDWQPGQFYIYGNYNYDHWTAGEVHCFQWKDVPHGTANASSYPRSSLVITGIRTDLTDQLVSSKIYTEFKV
jgi:hypothetical protein